jgi:DNA-binding transcriptional MerR regulator
MNKSREAFRTISEVSEWLDTPAHVLRFWESKFTQIKPVKRAGGRRYYRPEDMALLGGIKTLLHDQGLTIKGVQKLLRDQGNRHVMAMGPAGLPLTGAGVDLAADDTDLAVDNAPPSLTSAAEVIPVRQPSAMPRAARLPEPAPMAPALLQALARVDRRGMQQRAARIAPLLVRLTEIRDRMARG